MTTLATASIARAESRSDEPSRAEMLRLRLAAALTRLVRWEYWPSWAIYLPLVPYILFLALRHRGLRTCTRANPGIPLGGIVGESKWDILRLLPPESIVPTEVIRPGPLEDRMVQLERAVNSGAWNWPIILKPDVGQRGEGVRAVASLSEARSYLGQHPGVVLAQRFHPGPYEAGVFYHRFPNQRRGTIFSITDKRFASIRGNGRCSMRTLIWRHPRYRAQANVFLSHLGPRADTIPAQGETVALGTVGNHCRGALFLDGAHFITPALEAAFDAISLRTTGVHFGRYDVRYSDPAEFAAGRGFEIVELNGLLSESTNIYDPRTSYWQAQRVLRRQWRIAYLIGADWVGHERRRVRP